MTVMRGAAWFDGGECCVLPWKTRHEKTRRNKFGGARGELEGGVSLERQNFAVGQTPLPRTQQEGTRTRTEAASAHTRAR